MRYIIPDSSSSDEDEAETSSLDVSFHTTRKTTTEPSLLVSEAPLQNNIPHARAVGGHGRREDKIPLQQVAVVSRCPPPLQDIFIRTRSERQLKKKKSRSESTPLLLVVNSSPSQRELLLTNNNNRSSSERQLPSNNYCSRSSLLSARQVVSSRSLVPSSRLETVPSSSRMETVPSSSRMETLIRPSSPQASALLFLPRHEEVPSNALMVQPTRRVASALLQRRQQREYDAQPTRIRSSSSTNNDEPLFDIPLVVRIPKSEPSGMMKRKRSEKFAAVPPPRRRSVPRTSFFTKDEPHQVWNGL